ncbi:MAG: hypothetical protein ACK2U6_00425, partial [Candidatus Promineifilaceae bacterium]
MSLQMQLTGVVVIIDIVQTTTMKSNYLRRASMRAAQSLAVLAVVLSAWLLFSSPVSAANCYYHSPAADYVCDSAPQP